MKLTEALRIADEVLLIDNSGLEPHEAFAISCGVVQSFDIDDSQELHVQMAAKVPDRSIRLIRRHRTDLFIGLGNLRD